MQILKNNLKNISAIDFLLWLYEHCNKENTINFRFLKDKENRNTFYDIDYLRNNPEIVQGWILRESLKFEASYFAVATRKRSKGTKEGIKEIPALWVDLDGTPLEKVLESQYPPSAIVETSPGKYHVYWKLEKPAKKEDISIVENLLKGLSVHFGGDKGSTDASRILRIPGTFNYKTNPAFIVRVHDLNDKEYGLSDFDNLPQLDYEIKGTSSNEPINYEAIKNEKLKKIMECDFLQHCDRNRATLLEPHWYAMISNLARKPGGVDLIHSLSKGYPNYSREETDEKILHASNDSGPITCWEIKKSYDCGRDCGVKSPVGLACKGSEEKQEITSTAFPVEVMGGVAGEFAKTYASYMEPPEAFFFMAFMTCLGNILADQITLASEIRPQPRLYTILLGESADDRKSTAILKTIDFFRDAEETFAVAFGTGSAEGLQKMLTKKRKTLLCFDELKQFVNKCKIDTSTLLQCVNTLFEGNRYENATKTGGTRLENAYLSFLAASTLQTYESIWTREFISIGFNNRLFIVPASGQRKFAIPKKIPEEAKQRLTGGLKNILEHTKKHKELIVTPEAKKIFEEWYLKKPPTIHAKRIDTYALRLMILFAINAMKFEIDEEIVKKVITLCDWQTEVRMLHDPVDADNKIAELEEKIRRNLKKRGDLTQREIRQWTKADRQGTWILETALKNLERIGDIVLRNKKYALVAKA